MEETEQMRRFFIKLISIFIPVKSWRKAFRKKMKHKDVFGNLRSVFQTIKVKRDTVLKNKKSCEIIALGSSHGAYGLNPTFIGQNCFNLCSNSQDLYTAEYVFEYMKERLPHLKKVILFFDVFSRGWRLDKTSATNICAAYTHLYGINYPFYEDKENFLKKCRALDKKKLKEFDNENGYLNPKKMGFTETVEDRVNFHLREYNREEPQYEYLKNIIKSIKDDQKINMAILIPPLRQDYQKLLPENLLLNDAKELTKGTKVQIWDFSSDKDFTDDDFYDYDHLSSQGAEKLSKKLKGLL